MRDFSANMSHRNRCQGPPSDISCWDSALQETEGPRGTWGCSGYCGALQPSSLRDFLAKQHPDSRAGNVVLCRTGIPSQVEDLINWTRGQEIGFLCMHRVFPWFNTLSQSWEHALRMEIKLFFFSRTVFMCPCNWVCEHFPNPAYNWLRER